VENLKVESKKLKFKVEIMKIKNIFLTGLALLMISVTSFSQDKRTLETKIADLLAQFPVNDLQYLDKLMGDMISLGEEGQKKICDQIIPAGTGDDTKSRFAVESFSRFLSSKGKESERSGWEKICITYASAKSDPGVKDFFLKQLQIIGGEKTTEALKMFISDKENCSAAIAAITAIGGETAEHILAEALRGTNIPCAAAVMNALAGMNSQAAVNEYIAYAADENVNTKAAAFNALARSGSPLAYPVLLKAAKSYAFRWERTGATSALLNYASVCGRNGNLKTADKICKLLITKCNDKLNMQNKTAALKLFTDLHGIDAMPEIFKAAAHPDNKYRNAAIRMSVSLRSKEVTQKWIGYFPKAIPEARPEIINMLGSLDDKDVLPLIKSALDNTDVEVRVAAAEVIAKISGNDAAPFLINYMMEYQDPEDQEAAVTAFKCIAGNYQASLLLEVLQTGKNTAKKSAIELMAWKKDPAFFQPVLSSTSSDDEQVRKASFKALAFLAEPGDQEAILRLLNEDNNAAYLTDIQSALASAAGKISDPEKRSSTILNAMSTAEMKQKLIPVLPKTGGREALSVVLKEFENGNPEMRLICFKAITSWNDFSASSALFEICSSGNKSYEEQAFNGYLDLLKAAKLPDEQKLLLYRKVMPFALSSARKNAILTEVGNLKTYTALFFTSGYLDDPETASVAAKAAMFIALPPANSKNGMYGNNVRELLKNAANKLTGPESDYDREMINKYLEAMLPDEGFVPMFNGKDLSGWQGLVENPIARSKMKPAELAVKQAEADKKVASNWSVKDGCIWFNGSGENLCSIKEYGDFEMLADWKISKKGDSGIYLRGSPQVQIWDTSRVDAGAQVGSGGLYNNQNNPSKPLQVADNPVGDWNTFRIVMIGEKVSVWLNGILVVDNVILENYWDRKIPIFPKGSLELQAHGTDLGFRDIYVREISEKEYNLTPEEKSEGFVALFNGRNLDNWIGNKDSYNAEDGMIVIKPEKGSGGNLYTAGEYADFIFRFEFQLTPDANNGLGIRAPLEGDAAYVGMELQILDNTAAVYANLQPYQYHGSVYGVIPARKGYLKPVGEWNYEEVIAQGTRIKVILNGTVIVDGDIAGPRDNGTMDHNDHPGLKNKTGHIGFLGHGSVVRFRNIRIKDLLK
jgi:HEAT repeat protein